MKKTIIMNDVSIILPTRKLVTVTGYISGVLCAALTVVIQFNIFAEHIDAGETMIYTCFLLFIFLTSLVKIAVSPEDIRILLLSLPIRRIRSEKLARVEIMESYRGTYVLFEIGKCKEFAKSGFISSTGFYMFNIFRVVDYAVPAGEEEYVLSILKSMYEVQMMDMTGKM